MFAYLFKSIFRPTSKPGGFSPLKDVLKWPIIFDLVSLFLQFINLKRVGDLTQRNSNSSNYFDSVYKYNLSVTQTKIITTTRRTEMYYNLSTQPFKNTTNEKLLIVGPRNVQELFVAWIYGYSWKNISGIDLYSAHPKIKVMNMQGTDFDDNSFDVIVMANTLAYSQDTQATLSEMGRILNPGGRFIFGTTYDPKSTEWPGDLITGNEIIDMLKLARLNIYHYESAYKTNSHGREQASHTFCVQKPDPSFKAIDHLNINLFK